MENQNSVPDSFKFRNSQGFIGKKFGKVLGAAALAFTAQYVQFLQPQPAYAAAATTRAQAKPAESSQLSQLDQGYLLVDEARTLKTGLLYMRGENVVAFPAVDPDTKEYLLLALRWVNKLPEKETDSYLQDLAKVMGCDNCRILNQGATSFPVATQMLLNDGSPTEDEQRRIYFSLAYFYAEMAGGDCDDNHKGFEQAVSAFRALDDGSPWFKERLADFDLFNALNKANYMRAATLSETAQKYDLQKYARDVEYSSRVQEAVQVLKARTSAFRAGQMPTAEFMMGLAIFSRFSQEHLTYLQNLPKRGWFGGNVYKEAMESIGVILPALQEAFEAAGNEHEIQHLAQAREKLMLAQQLLEYQAILASKAYAMPDISGEEMIRWAQESYRFSQAVLAQHGPERLYLPSDFEAGLQQAYFAYTGAMPRYAELNNAANAGNRLSQLLAKVDGQGKRWLPEDKAALKALYRDVIASPSQDAEIQLLQTLRTEAIVASQPRVVVKPYSETGTRVNFAFSPIAMEQNGVVNSTTNHPVDTLIATFTIENKLPIPVRFNFAIELPGGITDNARDVQDVYVPANSFADVTYTAHVSITSTQGDNPPDLTPRADVILALQTLQEVASSTWGERVASAEVR